ncbi:acyloxyacyl hydrolase [Tolumonas lignilytica]|jgi:Lipid A 3-O-deacylase (PagL).|uniref:acyloxyacyl hydrolase n=1 Tax=Tolumonas lignilytica TaxID=1283284 RepID=UPI0004679C8C|nr:acyloxyacyl hydrolase [Tolumonas lignilytica]
MSVTSVSPSQTIKPLLAGCLLLLSQLSHATDLSLALGHSANNTTTYRAALQFPWQQSWLNSDAGALSGYWAAGYTYWESKHTVNTHSLSASPVLVWEFATPDFAIRPFIEAGIGIAAFSRNKVENRQLGSCVNFEDRFGLGVRVYQRHVIGIQALHYSNAGLGVHNAGIESYNIYYRFSF